MKNSVALYVKGNAASYHFFIKTEVKWNGPPVEHINNLDSSVTTVERNFLFKSHALRFLMGFWDAGYPQVSGTDQVIVPVTCNLRVPIR